MSISSKMGTKNMFKKGSMEATGVLVSEKAETVLSDVRNNSKRREEPLARHD